MEHSTRVGELHTTREWGDLIITAYRGNREVSVNFISTGYETIASYRSILKGCVRDRLLPSVHGVGIVGSEPISEGGKKFKEYELWCSMLLRCYDKKKHLAHPTYSDCTVSENFKYFPYFKDWCNKQVGFGCKDEKGRPFALDKDILIKGNKVYSEDTCCFVPPEINGLFLKCDRSRGKTLIGAHYVKATGKYSSSINKKSKLVSLGKFDTEYQAFLAYKEAKEDYVKEVANNYKNIICDKVYHALMNYTVDLDD